MATVCDDLIQYYLDVPIIPVDEGTREYELYTKILDRVFKNTLLEYSKHFPLYEEKVASWDKDQIDIFEDIDSRIISNGNKVLLYVFEPKDELWSKLNDLFLANYSTVLANQLLRSQTYSLLSFVEYKDIPLLLNELTKITRKPLVYGGRYLKVEPNVEYYMLYGRVRQYDPDNGICELSENDIEKFKELLHINLHIEVFSSRLYYDVLGIKSANISGLSTQFNNPQNTTVLSQFKAMKQQLLKKWSTSKVLTQIDTFY